MADQPLHNVSRRRSVDTPVDGPGSVASRLDLFATRLADIVEELTRPALTPADIDTASMPTVVADNWTDLQALTARAIGAHRPVTTEPEVSHYMAAVVRRHSYHWHTLAHAAGDTTGFRQGITDNVASVLGIPLTAGLVRRPLAGLVADDYPFIGWATHQELTAELNRLEPVTVPEREQQTLDLRLFMLCVRAGAQRGLDLVSVYDRIGTPDPSLTG